MSTSSLAEENALKWLVRLNSGDVSDSEQQAFFRWLEAAPENQAAYIQAELLWQRGGVLEKVRPASELRRSWYGWLGACASLLVIFAIASTYLLQQHNAEQKVYSTGIGEQLEVDLVDGSRVILNTHSELQVAFSDEARRVILKQGEAFFDIKPEINRPFDVETPSGAVRVLGTRFAVLVGEQTARVTVEKGRVALGEKQSEKFIAKVELKNNETANLLSQGGVTTVSSVDAQNKLAWRKQQLIFKGEPLLNVVGEIQRYWPKRIEVADPVLQDRRVTAVVQLSGKGFSAQQLAVALQLKVTELPDGSLQLGH